MRSVLKGSFENSIEYVTYRQEKDEELLKFLVLFLTSTASVDTDAIISYELWGSHSLTVMSLLRKRYDRIALFLQTVPKAHHNLA